MSENQCQIHCLQEMSETPSCTGILWQRKNRLKRIIKRRLNFMLNLLSEVIGKRKQSENLSNNTAIESLKSGDIVRVKPQEEIQATLNRWNQLKGCAFMEEMWPYCGTTQQIYKRVEKFLDERDYLMKKCNGIVLLKDIICEGTKDFGPCDRSCFIFWREEWLEKIDAES